MSVKQCVEWLEKPPFLSICREYSALQPSLVLTACRCHSPQGGSTQNLYLDLVCIAAVNIRVVFEWLTYWHRTLRTYEECLRANKEYDEPISLFAIWIRIGKAMQSI